MPTRKHSTDLDIDLKFNSKQQSNYIIIFNNVGKFKIRSSSLMK